MMSSKWLIRSMGAGMLAVSLGAVASAAESMVEVKFAEPAKFTDFGEFDRDREQAMSELKRHIEKLAQRDLPGKQIRIEFTDIDLAGELEPRVAAANRIRVLRSVTIPRLQFTYAMLEDGKEVAAGKASLKDMNYQSSVNRYFDSEPLRYEKRMLDEWVAKDLMGKQAGVAKVSR